MMAAESRVKGTLIPIGGNEDKGMGSSENYTLDFIEDGILSHVVRESGGTDARIVVIPTASSIPKEVGENYVKAFGKLGCENVEVLHISKKSHSKDVGFIRAIEQADCVMFSGGDQSKIVNKIGGSKMHDLLLDRYKLEKFVIAGTSAGAMAMAKEMIAGGSITESLFKGAVRMREGMGFIPGLIIDSHFIQRGRFGRMAEAVAKFPHLLGIGLAEDTGLIIKNCNECRVIGSGMVVIFDPSKLTHNKEALLDEGTPMSMSNLVVHILANSDKYILDNRRIEVLPMEADFI
jgi:cyanophycinase